MGVLQNKSGIIISDHGLLDQMSSNRLGQVRPIRKTRICVVHSNNQSVVGNGETE